MTDIIETNINPIDYIKKAAVDFINSHEFFANIPAIWDELGDLDTQVSKKLQELGIGIVLECNEGRVRYPSIGSQAIDQVATITITENVLINRDPANNQASGKTAADIVCELFAIFNPATARDPLPITLESYEVISNTQSVIIYQITGKARAGWKIKT